MDAGRCHASERRRQEEKSRAERCCSHSAGSVTCTVWRLTALCNFFFLKIVYLVNSEEPESQNCCSRNHFEGDNFKRFSIEPTVPKRYTLKQCWPAAPPGAHPKPVSVREQTPCGAGSACSGSGRSKGTLRWGRAAANKNRSRTKSLTCSLSEHISTLPAAHAPKPTQGVGCKSGVKGRAGELPHSSTNEGPGQTSAPKKHTLPLGTPKCKWKSHPGRHRCSG